MTNGEKYKTANERGKAFGEWAIRERHHDRSRETFESAFAWLDLEAEEEKPLPCPFCGAKTSVNEHPNTGACWVMCENGECRYSACYADSEDAAIAAHNRVARAAAKGKEADNG